MSTEPIVLKEHTKKQPTEIKGVDLSSSDLEILNKLEKENKIDHSVDAKTNQLLISTNSHIGSVKLEGPDVRINVLPKVFEDDVNWEDTNIFLDYTSSGNLDYYENAKNFYTGTHEETLLNRLHVNVYI